MSELYTGFQTNFTSGEISPRLHGHVDLGKYKNAVKTAENAICLPQGPIVKRPGTLYLDDAQSTSSRLYRFQFDKDNVFILEFYNNNVKIYNYYVNPVSVVTVSTSIASSAIPELSFAQSGRTLYITHKTAGMHKLVWEGSTNWTFSNMFFYPPPTYEAGSPVAQSLTLSATSGLGKTATAGSASFLPADVGRQIHNLTGTGKASIVGYTSATVVTVDILENFPSTSLSSNDWKMDLSPVCKIEVDNFNVGSTAIVESYYSDSARGPAITISSITVDSPALATTSAVHGLTSGDKVELKGIQGMPKLNNSIWGAGVLSTTTLNFLDVDSKEVDSTLYMPYVASSGTLRKVFTDISIDAFRSSDVGKFILVNGGVGQITEYISGNKVKMEIQKSLNSLQGTSNWSLEDNAWNATDGYPSALCFYQQRLWFAGNTKYPQRIWGSAPAIYDAFGVGSLPDDAIEIDIASSDVNEIRWIRGLRDRLVVGISGTEITVGTDVGGEVSVPVSLVSASYQEPTVLENEMLFVDRSEGKLNSFKYSFEIDSYVSEDLLFMADHLVKNGGGIKRFILSQAPDRKIYAVLADGTMLCGTYQRDQQVMAWTSIITDGSFKDVQFLSKDIDDDVFILVDRSSTGRIEKFYSPNIYHGADNNVSVYTDSTGTLSATEFAISAITAAAECQVTATAHGYSTGYVVRMYGDDLPTEVVGKKYDIEAIDVNNFKILKNGSYVDSTLFNVSKVSGGDGIVRRCFTTISGLSHLEGKTVQVKADGAAHPDEVVSSGQITLNTPCHDITVGLAYNFKVETLQREFSLQKGSVQGIPIRPVRPILKLYNSCLPTLNAEFIPARNPTDLMDKNLGLESGDIEYGSLYWAISESLTIESRLPFQLVLLGIFGTTEVNF